MTCNHFPNVCQVGFICASPGPKRAHVIIYVHFCLVFFSMDPAPLCMPAFIRHPVAPEALGADLTSDNSSKSPNPISHERSSQGQGPCSRALRQQHPLKLFADLGAGNHSTCSLM